MRQNITVLYDTIDIDGMSLIEAINRFNDIYWETSKISDVIQININTARTGSWDGRDALEVNIVRKETEAEFEERKAKQIAYTESRYQTYLQLKEEFKDRE